MKYLYILPVLIGSMSVSCASSKRGNKQDASAPNSPTSPSTPDLREKKTPNPPEDNKKPEEDGGGGGDGGGGTGGGGGGGGATIDAQGFDTVTGLHQFLGVDRNLALPNAEAQAQLQAFKLRTFVNTYGITDKYYDQRELYPQGYEIKKRVRSPYQQRPTAPMFHDYNMERTVVIDPINGMVEILEDQPKFFAFLPPASLAYVPDEVKAALRPYLATLQKIEIAFVPQRRLDYCTDFNSGLKLGGVSIQLKAHSWVRSDIPIAFKGGYYGSTPADTIQMGLFAASIPAASLSGAGVEDPQVGSMRPIGVSIHDDTLSGPVGNLFMPAILAENEPHCFFSTYSLVVQPAENRAIVTLHWVLEKNFYDQVLAWFALLPDVPDARKDIEHLINYAKSHMAYNDPNAPLLMKFPQLGVEQLERLAGFAP